MGLLPLLLLSCKSDKNKFSEVPFLQIDGTYVYNNGVDKDSFVLAQLYYHDGDGDVGLNAGDTFSPFGANDAEFYNLKIWMLEKKNGVWIKPVNPLSPTKDTLNFHERLPVLTPSGRVKWIEGHLDVRIPAEPFSLKPDTIKLQFQLTDRSLKRSKLVESEVLVLKH